MFDVLGITAPIFLLIGLGYLACFRRWLNREQVRGLGIFVINLALPALVIEALGRRPIGEVLDARYLLAYAGASLLSFVAGWALFRWRGAGRSDAAIAGLGSAVSNSGFVGYPIAALVAGPAAGVALALCMLVENLLIVPLALALAEAGRQQSGGLGRAARDTLARLARNPLILGIVIGVALSVSEVHLPVALHRVIELLAGASVPVALFVIGGILHGTRMTGQLGEISCIGLGKLVLHPLLVGAAVWLVGGMDLKLALAGVLFASAPMMSVYPIIGQRFGVEERCAAALLLATLASFVTISVLLSGLRLFGLF